MHSVWTMQGRYSTTGYICGMIASNESCGTDPSQASCLACGCGPVAIGPSNPPATRRKLSVSDVDALKAALVSALANVSLAQIDIQTLTNGSLVCIEALNDLHADYLLVGNGRIWRP